LGEIFYKKGDLTRAHQLAQDSLNHAIEIGQIRGIINGYFLLTLIHLRENELEKADAALEICKTLVIQHEMSDKVAEMQHLQAKLYILRKNIPAAHAALIEAIDLFERLGIRRELVEAREELARLETQM
jgi:tetratricopeptide (TPR) repeat protein